MNQSRDFIYLASQSASRQQLLKIADIPFKVLPHTSSEVEDDITLEFSARVLAIAEGKMKTINQLPEEAQQSGKPVFVLTADTLIRAVKSNIVLSKPKDVDEARSMIALLRNEPAEVVTGCCLEKREFKDGAWIMIERRAWATSALAEFIIEEAMVDRYFEHTPFFLNISGGCAVEGFGQSFLKSVNGSYTGIQGLPLFELRQALKELDFKF